jgi:hypothetical protein
MTKSVVIVTTTAYALQSEYEHVRANLTLALFQEAVALGYSVICIDDASHADFRKKIPSEVHVSPQRVRGIGNARRQCIAAGVESGAEIIVYVDPEKSPFIAFLESCLAPLYAGTADFVVPARRSLTGYPLFQQYGEQFINAYWAELTGTSFDVSFGPRCFTRDLAYLFLEYDGAYGDKWDSIFIPVMRAVKEKVRMASVVTDFVYPASQRKIEAHDLYFYDKRLEQVNNLVSAFCSYWNTYL